MGPMLSIYVVKLASRTQMPPAQKVSLKQVNGDLPLFCFRFFFNIQRFIKMQFSSQPELA